MPINDTVCLRPCAAGGDEWAVEREVARDKQDDFEELKSSAGKLEGNVHCFMG